MSPSRGLVHEKGAGLSFLAVNGAVFAASTKLPSVCRTALNGLARLHRTTWEDTMQMRAPECRSG